MGLSKCLCFKVFVAGVFAATVSLEAGESEAGAAKPAKNRSLDGTWEIASAQLGGKPFPEKVARSMKLILKGNTYTMKSPGPLDKGVTKTDRSTRPYKLDIKGTEGPNKGRTILAIFKHRGETLTVCYDLGGWKRPTEFKSAAGTLQYLVVYKRK